MIFPQIENLCVIVKFVGFTNGASINHEHKMILWLNSRILITVGYLFIPTKRTQMYVNGKNIIFYDSLRLLSPFSSLKFWNSQNVRNQVKENRWENILIKKGRILWRQSFSILISFFHCLWMNFWIVLVFSSWFLSVAIFMTFLLMS